MQTKGSESLLARQLRLMGLDEEPARLDDAAEAARIRTFDLPRLDLAATAARVAAGGAAAGSAPRAAPRRAVRQLYWAPVLALAAAVLTVILAKDDLWPQPGTDATIRAKGEGKVWVYWERGGVVTPWSPETRLENGDRVRVEVLAGEDVLAWLVVSDRTGSLLSPEGPEATEPLALTEGEQAAFPGSVKLVGRDDGETLEVWTCPRRGGDDELKRLVREAFKTGARRLTDLADVCDSERFPLR